MQAVKGSFALVIMTKDKLIGQETSWNKTLCIGKLDEAYILSSESCEAMQLCRICKRCKARRNCCY